MSDPRNVLHVVVLAAIVATQLGATPPPAQPASASPTSTVTADAATPLTPEKIYLRAVRAMKDAPQPAYVTFHEEIAGRNITLACTGDGIAVGIKHGDVTAAYDVSFRTSDGGAVSQPVGAASAKPCPGALLIPAGSGIASLGLPQASPSPGPSPTTAPADAQIGPPLVAAVRVEGARYYHIDLAGLEQLGANQVYHLKLRAYRDPDTHPLTDLYVDPQTFLIREARGEGAGHYVIASARFAGIVDFDRVGAYWLVEREYFEAAANALFVHARFSATVAGSNFATPEDLPGVVFPTPQPTASPNARPSRSA
jgi:hypothetical protein